ncbi:hypothetical protein [Fodinicola acaciae]|uniref:hypothetical protein n=1 Tax=Fodinicola acaciae TaxID=2681555 RepID=UPI0013D03A4C|nr:hypothetical protein [Fodinicola acaciae]
MPELGHDEVDGKRLLASLRGVEPDDHTSVDVSRAVRSGRRQVRMRHSVLPAAGGLAVILLVATLALVVQQTRGAQQPVAGRGAFPVAEQAFRIGSAGGLTPLTYQTGRFRQRVELGPADGSGLSGITAAVTMYARGAVASPTGSPTDPVDGRPAYWITADGANPVELAWQYAPDAWGFVTVTGRGASRDRAYKVALSVTTGAHDPVTAPVVVPPSTIGDGYRIVGYRSTIGPKVRPHRYVEVLYGIDDEGGWIAAGLTSPGQRGAGSSTVGGRPAVETATSVTFTDGSGIFAEASDPAYLSSYGGLPALRRVAAAATTAPGFRWPEVPSPSPTDSHPAGQAPTAGSTEPTPTPTPS